MAIDEQHIFTGLLTIRDLPTLPQVVIKILEAVEDEYSSAADLTTLLEQDHAISARVLRLANSAFYGLRNEVDTINPFYSRCCKKPWKHSTETHLPAVM